MPQREKRHHDLIRPSRKVSLSEWNGRGIAAAGLMRGSGGIIVLGRNQNTNSSSRRWRLQPLRPGDGRGAWEAPGSGGAHPHLRWPGWGYGGSM